VSIVSCCRSMRVPRALLLFCGIVLLVPASAGAVPKPPPKFWSPARCERVMLTQHPAVRQVLCVASGGPSTCRWTSGHRARLYSEFTVFTRLLHLNVTGGSDAGAVQPSVVRSFTLATRARPGFGRIVHHYGDQYAGWPADFFMGHVKVLATHVTPGQFRPVVAPFATRMMQEAKATGCTGS
jgi:hypothetical protein